MANATAARLGNFPHLRTADLDEAREGVARVLGAHRLALAGPGGRLDVVHNSVALDRVSLNYLDYGTPVHVEPGELDSLFVVVVPMAGRSRVVCGKQEVVSTPDVASVPTPTEHLDMDDAGEPKLIVKVDRSVLEDTLQGLLGHPLPRPVRFELGMDLTSAAGRGWLDLLRYVLAEVERGDGLVRQPLALAHVEDALLTSLLYTQWHSYTEPLRVQQASAPPKVIRRAMGVIEERADQPLTTGDVAQAVAVSVRALQEGFQRHLGCSPTAYLRDVRLRYVHDDLAAADPAQVTVTDAALGWGFCHLGRFAVAYRAKFGESPSQTLRG